MAVTKISISLDEELADELRTRADEAGMSTSSFVADALRDRLRHLALVRYLLAFEHEAGPIPDHDIEIAERILDGELDEWPA